MKYGGNNMNDKYTLSEREARFLLKKNIVELIHSTSRLEKVNTTFPQTKTIIDGMSVSGISTDDIQVILNLKNAYQYVLNLPYTTKFDIWIACKINSFVSYNESLDWGVLRTGNIGIHGVSYQPRIPNEKEVIRSMESIWSSETTNTFKVLKYMYYAMRSQLFWDGNKRTALISANAIMMLSGSGAININENQLDTWNDLLSEFYETNDDTTIIGWTYDNCIYGIDYK